jgi:hypothetical protein
MQSQYPGFKQPKYFYFCIIFYTFIFVYVICKESGSSFRAGYKQQALDRSPET